MRRRSFPARALKSRSAGLVITKSHGMLPRLERDELVLFVRAPPVRYCSALLCTPLLKTDPAQTKIDLQGFAYDGRAAALAALGFPFDRKRILGGNETDRFCFDMGKSWPDQTVVAQTSLAALRRKVEEHRAVVQRIPTGSTTGSARVAYAPRPSRL